MILTRKGAREPSGPSQDYRRSVKFLWSWATRAEGLGTMDGPGVEPLPVERRLSLVKFKGGSDGWIASTRVGGCDYVLRRWFIHPI